MVYASLLLLLCVSVGYLYYTSHPVKKYELKRWDGKLLSIRVSMAGFVLTMTSILLVELADNAGLFSGSFAFLKPITLPAIERSTPFVAANLWFMVVPFVLTWLVLDWRSVYYLDQKPYELAEASMDTFERMLLREQRDAVSLNIDDDRFVRLVLNNDKVYIGYVLKPDIERGAIGHVEIAPMFSGYICAEKRGLKLTNNYGEHYVSEILHNDDVDVENLDEAFTSFLKLFSVIIPTEVIVSSSLFKYDDYEQIGST